MLYRNQSIDLLRKSMDWFLYDIGLRHERVKNITKAAIISFLKLFVYDYWYMIISRIFQLQETWRLMKAIAEMKLGTEQTTKLE